MSRLILCAFPANHIPLVAVMVLQGETGLGPGMPKRCRFPGPTPEFLAAVGMTGPPLIYDNKYAAFSAAAAALNAEGLVKYLYLLFLVWPSAHLQHAQLHPLACTKRGVLKTHWRLQTQDHTTQRCKTLNMHTVTQP